MSMVSTRLAHLHLPRPIPYAHSLRLQEIFLEKNFAYNTANLQYQRSKSTANKEKPVPPLPTLLTFQTQPVYTVGRRHLKSNPLSTSQIKFLTTNADLDSSENTETKANLATFYPSPRGGLLTYHAPGQLTAYLILNLKYHNITPRCFIRMLENTVIRTCARHGVPNTLTTADPGVWIGEREPGKHMMSRATEELCGGDADLNATTRKICAIGVHVSRGITSHGIGLNVTDTAISPVTFSEQYVSPPKGKEKPRSASGYLSWGFDRIVACGLEGKSVTWLTKEGANANITPNDVAVSFAEEICKSLTSQGRVEITGIDPLTEDDTLAESMILSTEKLD